MTFTPSIDQIADPEPGSFQHKSHVGIDEKGNIVAEGEVEKKWTDFLNGPIRAKVSFILEVIFEVRIGVDLSMSYLASTISNHARLEEAEEIPA